MRHFEFAQLDEIAPIRCPCGSARRAFQNPNNALATIHLVDVQGEAQIHHHKQTTEFYVILEGNGFIELDGVRVAVKPMSAVMIKPGCRHRAIGNFKMLNIPVPAFDPADEFLD